MEVGHQIKKYRMELGINQEELAEKVYVSRQTISNWENDKSYPDVNSLIRLSEAFDISIDTLIKGDIEMMREEIKEEEIRSFSTLSKVYTGLFLIMIVSAVPLFIRGLIGIAVWAVIAAVTLFVAFKVEKEKKRHDLKTYKQITAFMDGKHLDELDTAVENGKAKYQTALFAIGAGLLALAVCVVLGLLIYLLK